MAAADTLVVDSTTSRFQATQLGPQALIQRQAEEARNEYEHLLAQKPIQIRASTSGPQGQIKPLTLVQDPSAWSSFDMKPSSDWIYKLSCSDVEEIDEALRLVAALGLRKEGNLLHIQEKVKSTDQFLLPTLGPKLQAFRNEVVHGRGFFLIRGLPVERYTREEVVIVYWGFGLWWGNVVSQNAKSTIPTLLPKMVTDNAKNTAHGRGHIIGHVKDIGHDIDQPITRVYATPLAQPWHNDSADVVALLCLKQAKEGGLSSWSSSVSIHNEMLRLGRKDLVEELAKPIWWIDRKGEIPEGKAEAYQQPIFQYHEGYLSCNHTGTYYHLAQRHSYVPRMTLQQKQALAIFNALAGSDSLRMDFKLQPGDIQLLNNLTMQHQRSSFVDCKDIKERRHLLRLWISPTENRPLPEEYKSLWNSTTPGFRGGIQVSGNMTVPMEAE